MHHRERKAIISPEDLGRKGPGQSLLVHPACKSKMFKLQPVGRTSRREPAPDREEERTGENGIELRSAPVKWKSAALSLIAPSAGDEVAKPIATSHWGAAAVGTVLLKSN